MGIAGWSQLLQRESVGEIRLPTGANALSFPCNAQWYDSKTSWPMSYFLLIRAMLIPELTRIAKAWFDLILTCSGIVVYYCGLARLVIGLRPRSPRVLMYHACEEAESDFTRGLSINTTPARFAAQLDFLQKYYRVVPLESLGGDAQPDRAVVITFDDGFRSVYDHALPLLSARNLPATC
jgi:hypothetical protein